MTATTIQSVRVLIFTPLRGWRRRRRRRRRFRLLGWLPSRDAHLLRDLADLRLQLAQEPLHEGASIRRTGCLRLGRSSRLGLADRVPVARGCQRAGRRNRPRLPPPTRRSPRAGPRPGRAGERPRAPRREARTRRRARRDGRERQGSPRLVQSALLDHQLYELHPIVVLGLDLDPKNEDTGVPRIRPAWNDVEVVETDPRVVDHLVDGGEYPPKAPSSCSSLKLVSVRPTTPFPSRSVIAKQMQVRSLFPGLALAIEVMAAMLSLAISSTSSVEPEHSAGYAACPLRARFPGGTGGTARAFVPPPSHLTRGFKPDPHRYRRVDAPAGIKPAYTLRDRWRNAR